MIIGNPSVFAIESSITRAYERLSFRARGFFVIYAGGRCYGKRSPDSTLLACSYEEVERRTTERGTHSVPFSIEPDGRKIADAVRSAIYAEEPDEYYFGVPRSAFSDMIYSRHVLWAPDGDEAFDDRSYVLQFDIGDRVRLIAFKSGEGYARDDSTFTDTWLAADDFYHILRRWHDDFTAEWASMDKTAEGHVR